jgi:hypothetical protein
MGQRLDGCGDQGESLARFFCFLGQGGWSLAQMVPTAG